MELYSTLLLKFIQYKYSITDMVAFLLIILP